MPFWTPRRGSAGSSTDGSLAHSLEPALQPIQLFLADRRLEGWIVSTDERITDLLNRREIFRVCVDPTNDVWESANLDELLLIAPPTHDSDGQRRIHRRRARLFALVGPYVVSGVAHTPMGVDAEDYVLRTRQQFLPLTDAHVTSRTDGSVDEQLPVVIVNVGNLTELRALLTSA